MESTLPTFDQVEAQDQMDTQLAQDFDQRLDRCVQLATRLLSNYSKEDLIQLALDTMTNQLMELDDVSLARIESWPIAQATEVANA